MNEKASILGRQFEPINRLSAHLRHYGFQILHLFPTQIRRFVSCESYKEGWQAVGWQAVPRNNG
jgi:hypothetical protein